MVYEYFIQHQLLKGKNTCDWRFGLLMQMGEAAANPNYQKEKWVENINIPYNESKEWNSVYHIWRLADGLQSVWEQSRLQEWLDTLMEKAQKDISQSKEFYILPYMAYYETFWNGRKGYGQLVDQVRELQKNCSFQMLISGKDIKGLGESMAAMADCYDLMSEEAYDQREVFAQYLKEGAKAYQAHWNEDSSVSADHLLIAYALLKGVRLHVLNVEEYGRIAKLMLLALESNGFEHIGDELKMKGQGDKGLEALSCMLAFGEYNKLKKERPYYGI